MKHYKHEIRKTSDLIPYANNSRTHSKTQVKQIASSIKEFGFTNPILIDDNSGIIAGHGRVQAAEILKMDVVPCIVVRGLTEAQKKALVIADNQLALTADWDIEMLKLEIATLTEMEFDIDLIGFDPDDIKKMFDDDDEPPENTVTNEDKNMMVIEFDTEEQCAILYEELMERGFMCEIMS